MHQERVTLQYLDMAGRVVREVPGIRSIPDTGMGGVAIVTPDVSPRLPAGASYSVRVVPVRGDLLEWATGVLRRGAAAGRKMDERSPR